METVSKSDGVGNGSRLGSATLGELERRFIGKGEVLKG